MDEDDEDEEAEDPGERSKETQFDPIWAGAEELG